MRTHKAAVLLSSLLSLIVLSTVFFLFQKRDVEQERIRYGYIIQNQVNHIVSTIDRIMTRTETLKALIRDHHGNTDFFDEMAMTVYDSVRDEMGVSLKNVAIAPNGVVTNVYPYDGNETLIGFSFLDVDRPGNAKAIEAYEKGDTVLTNPFPLVQGGIGMAGRSPVILKEIDGNRLWGLVTVTIDFENLIEHLHLDRLAGMGMLYELSYIESDGSVRILDAHGMPDSSAVRTRFACRNLYWELALSPEKGWIPVWKCVLTVIFILILSAFVGMFTDMVFRLRESNAELLTISNTDRLTGCANRRAYEDDMGRYRDEEPGEDFVYAAVDVNGLKHVNDSLGHAAGDEIIRGAADCLRNCFDGCGKLYRTGGDEFVILFFADEERFAALRDALTAETSRWKGQHVDSLSISVGYAARREFPDIPLVRLARQADDRMYEDKRAFYQRQGNDRRKTERE